MFDALRRAEAERRRRANRLRNKDAQPEIEPAELPPVPPVGATREGVARAPAPVSGQPLPESLMRELGILRNSIETALGRRDKQSLLFTASGHGEGTTSIAVSYAHLLAMDSAERVLLVEMNARSPALLWRLGLKGREGVTRYLGGGIPLSDVVQRPANYAFDVVHVGEGDPARIQLNIEREFPRLVTEARSAYGTVIVDAPPIIGSPEALSMTAAVDGVIVVTQCEKTKLEIVRRSLNMITQFGGNTLGVVLNRKKYYIPGFIYKRI